LIVAFANGTNITLSALVNAATKATETRAALATTMLRLSHTEETLAATISHVATLESMHTLSPSIRLTTAFRADDPGPRCAVPDWQRRSSR
jgi:hypothetical protein